MDGRPRARTAQPAPGTLLALILYAFAGPMVCVAQSSDNGDRLARLRDLTRNSEMVILWSEEGGLGTNYAKQRIYDLDLDESTVSQRLARHPVVSDSVVVGRRQMTLATGNFTGSEVEHVVAAWNGPDAGITIVVPHIASGSLDRTNASRLTIDGPTTTSQEADIRLASGDFTGGGFRDEFLLGFVGEDGALHLQVHGFPDDGLDPFLIGSISDENVAAGLESWDLVVGDFDGDGTEEFAILFINPGGGSDWSLTAKIYRVTDLGTVVAGPAADVFPRPGFSFTSLDVSGTAGDLDSDAAIELAVGITFAQDAAEPDTYIYPLDVMPDLSAITASDTIRVAMDAQNESEISPINLATGDLDGDSQDELVMSIAGGWEAFKFGGTLLPESFKMGGAPEPNGIHDSNRFLTVDDMDADGNAEIILAGSTVELEPSGEQYVTLSVFSLDETLTPRLIAQRFRELPVSNDLDTRHFAIASGDFDGDRMRLGEPVHYSRRGVLQPSVVLNTPPIHYDVLDGTSYDLSGCFPQQSCGFSSAYAQTSSNEMTVSLEFHQDWGASASTTTELEALKLKATATYGEKFSETLTDRESVRISTGRAAAGDDWIYAAILDIDYYEYPVYDGDNPEPVGYYLVSVPLEARPLWIESKNDALLGNQFRPDHEVGNVLSYRTTDGADVASSIVVFDEQTIGSTGSSFATLELSTFTENSAAQSWDGGFEFSATAGLSLDIYGIEVGQEFEFGGSYSQGEVTTQTVTVQESLEMRSDFGRLENEYGTSATYQIEPYAYWTVYGALAIDYKVSLPSDPSSFWQTWYGGKTDLGFSMPWRYDAEKGLPVPGGDETYAMRSRDIVLSIPDPEGGDTVRVGARVRNMGLADAPAPIDVDFYLGDPDAGGTPIASATTDSTIGAQSSVDLIVEWIIPESAQLSDARIYAVVDADDEITNEVHTNNNKGWAPAVSYGTPTDTEAERDDLPGGFVLQPAYPNPFRNLATISMELAEPAHVVLTVYDVLGREVALVADEMISAGRQRYVIDGSAFAPGVYFYSVVTQQVGGDRQIRETGKLVLVR